MATFNIEARRVLIIQLALCAARPATRLAGRVFCSGTLPSDSARATPQGVLLGMTRGDDVETSLRSGSGTIVRKQLPNLTSRYEGGYTFQQHDLIRKGLMKHGQYLA